jgi:hypothetical protein
MFKNLIISINSGKTATFCLLRVRLKSKVSVEIDDEK